MNARTALLLAALAATSLAASAQTTLRRTVDRMPSFDPIQSESVGAMRCVSLVYETLLEYDYLARPYRLRGCIAEDLPEVSADGRTLTFRLRRGIHFGPDICLSPDPATGRPGMRDVVAADVVYSFKRLADAKLSSPGYWTVEGKIEGIDAFHQASMGDTPTDYSLDIAGLRALDERTVEMRLTAPAPDFLWVLAMPYTAIVPREAVEHYGAGFESVDVGTGPYRLVAWRRNYRYAFERRPGRDIARDATPLLDDARDAVPIERITYLVMEDPSTRWLSFLSGGLDVAGDISRDNWDAVVGPDGDLTEDMKRRNIRLLAKPSLDTFYIGFNLDDPVLGGNVKLRQALSCASDPRQWETLNAGRVVGASGPVPIGIAGRLETPSPYAFDIEKAEALLAEAGYPGGVDPATGRRLALTLDLGRTDQEIRETAELFASFMDRIGVVVKLQYNNWPSFLKKIARREAQMFLIGWMADYPSALNFMQLFVGRNASPGPNRSNYANADYDALYDKADTTLDDDARLALVAQMQETIREACPWIFLYHRKANLLVHPHVRNVVMHDFPYGAEKHWRMMPK
ncbi:MAG: ABC transporter substrate-binding protein [Kiritimatiellia bacterium]|jgi:oligopeptide transport system substrate-binding protein